MREGEGGSSNVVGVVGVVECVGVSERYGLLGLVSFDSVEEFVVEFVDLVETISWERFRRVCSKVMMDSRLQSR